MDNPFKAISQVNPVNANGHREVPNAVWWALQKLELSGAEFRIALSIYDKTEGYSQESAKISMTHFQKLTRLSRESVANAIQQLEGSHIIVVARGSGVTPNEYLFNKYYDTWLSGQLSLPSSEMLTSQGKPTTSSSEMLTSQGKPTASSSQLATPDTEAKKEGSTETMTSQVLEPATEPVKKPLLKISIKDIFTLSKEKKPYGVGKNVYLTDEEHQKLVAQFGEAGTIERINLLSAAIGSKGYKYKSHYLTILHWEMMHKADKGSKGPYSHLKSAPATSEELKKSWKKPPPGKIATQEELEQWNQ